MTSDCAHFESSECPNACLHRITGGRVSNCLQDCLNYQMYYDLPPHNHKSDLDQGPQIITVSAEDLEAILFGKK